MHFIGEGCFFYQYSRVHREQDRDRHYIDVVEAILLFCVGTILTGKRGEHCADLD